MQKFSEWVKQVGATRAAEILGCSKSHIYQMARGDKQPSLASAYDIERATDGAVTMQSWLEPVE